MVGNDIPRTGRNFSVLSVAALVLGAVGIIRAASVESQVSESLTMLKYAFIPILCFAVIGSESLFSSENSKLSVRNVASFVSGVFILSVALVFLRWVPENSVAEVKISFTKFIIFSTILMLLGVLVNYLVSQKKRRENA